MRPRVIITDLEHESIEPELEVLGRIDAQVEWFDCNTDVDVIQAAADADALMVGYAPITRRVFKTLRKCRIVSRYGIGVDMVDIEAATECGVVVANVPDYCLDEVADHTMALLLACARKVPLLDRAVRDGRAVVEGKWNTLGVAAPVHRLSGQSLGIIGLGQIGRRVARRAQAFGLHVMAAPDPAVSHQEAAALGIDTLPLEQVLRQADHVSLHVPLTTEIHHLINAETLSLMKPTATIINTSRGPVVDQTALIEALQCGQIAATGLDVYEEEPLSQDSPLRKMDNAVLSSHAAWYSEEALYDLKVSTAQAVVDLFEGRVPRLVVNAAVVSRPRT
jgi:D-3-phosphoglycerate dehydrogenase